jgi:hypothetical protein
MRIKSIAFFVLLVAILTSCIEIIDDLTIRNDGSGKLKYTINLSASKLKLNSMLALDSLDGHKVPTIQELQEQLTLFKNKLAKKEGISSVVVESNFTDFIFKVECEFTSVLLLQDALKELVSEEMKDENISELHQNWLSWDGHRLIRSIPELTIQKTKKLKDEDIALLKQGNYTSITRFERPVEKCDNASAILAKNRLAVMIKRNPYDLIQNPNLLENVIYLSSSK